MNLTVRLNLRPRDELWKSDNHSRLSSVFLCWISREKSTDGGTIAGSKRQKTVCVENIAMNGAIHRQVWCLRMETNPIDDNVEPGVYFSLFTSVTRPAVTLKRDQYEGRNLDNHCRMWLICCFVELVQTFLITCELALADDTTEARALPVKAFYLRGPEMFLIVPHSHSLKYPGVPEEICWKLLVPLQLGGCKDAVNISQTEDTSKQNCSLMTTKKGWEIIIFFFPNNLFYFWHLGLQTPVLHLGP